MPVDSSELVESSESSELMVRNRDSGEG
jgi:hypothetical protein